MNEKIAVVIPVYNVEKYISKCIESVCTQSYPNLEIILVDDGSTDSSGEICDAYQKKDDRIRVFHTPNRGLSAARNYGVQQSESNWVIFIDSDDFVTSRYVEDLNTIRLKAGSEISVTQVKKINEESAAYIYSQSGLSKLAAPDIVKMTVSDALANMYYRKGIPIYAPGKLYLKSILTKHPFRIGEQYEDLSIMHHLFSEANAIGFAQVENYYYLQRPFSIVNSKFSENKMIQIPICKEIHQFIEEKYPKALCAAESKQFVVALNLYVDARTHHADKQVLRKLKKEAGRYVTNIQKDKNNSTAIRLLAKLFPASLVLLPSAMQILRKAQNAGWIKINNPF
ncbi:glycosyltransferase family 2 protein [Allobaculum fili]|uniref:glycosyltransferase family 2 protein n=1 Tax=Allobaculum fili TaxID=2834460 RepID=UPI001E378FC7|nr:glycosyltransferase family 2 protein [Allobaculum fili]